MTPTDQLWRYGFKHVGENVMIDPLAVFYGANRISIGNNVRIDAYAVLSAGEGGITIGDSVHIAAKASIIGAGPVLMKDYSALSINAVILSSNADYSGQFMTNPQVPIIAKGKKITSTTHAGVTLGQHVVVGVGSVILPGADIDDGCIVGALSMVKGGYYEKLEMLAGIPAKCIKMRKKNIFELAKLLK